MMMRWSGSLRLQMYVAVEFMISNEPPETLCLWYQCLCVFDTNLASVSSTYEEELTFATMVYAKSHCSSTHTRYAITVCLLDTTYPNPLQLS